MQNPLILPFEKTDPGNIELLGAKGARLAEDYRNLQQIFPGVDEKIAVPDGFIVTTEAWRLFNRSKNTLPEPLFESTLSEIGALEERTGRKFGDTSGRLPLFVAVRGGAPVSLPGALATVLNVGFNDAVASAMIGAGEDESFVLTTYLTSIRMYGEVVLDIPYDAFYRIIKNFGVEGSIPVQGLRTLITAFKGILDNALHPVFPPGFETGLPGQLKNVIEAVLGSWMSPVALEARMSRERPGQNIPADMGTAAIVQRMVFGNRDDTSLSGVLFTREQRSGANHPIIEWAPKVQCDKIVSGKLRKELLQAEDLEAYNPAIYERLLHVREAFECRARRPIDIEFTVESGTLFLLQRRPMRMTPSASVRAMWDMIDEGKTTIPLASMAINQALAQPEKALREDFTDFQVLASGEPVSDCADTGVLVFGSQAALELAERGQNVILLRKNLFGKGDLAVNHPLVRGIVRVDGHTTSHEAVSAVAYAKPYLIKTRDARGKPLLISSGEEGAVLNPESVVSSFIGKNVFLDGERGILGYSASSGFLEDKRFRKKLYVDWEYLKEQFDAGAYENCDYTELLDIHYQWELELEGYAGMQRALASGMEIPEIRLLHTFDTWLRCFRRADRIKAMRLKEVVAEDFEPGPPLAYHGNDLRAEVLKIILTLMLSTTWRTHWIHEILVKKALARGETENDVIRDINLNNRTMSLLSDFQQEGFHLMKTVGTSFLVFASNFEYEQDPDRLQVGPGALDYMEKDLLAQRFMEYLGSVNEPLAKRTRLINGEPPLGQGHARIVSVGLAAPEADFALLCRYLRSFLDRRSPEADVLNLVPETGFVDLCQIDPFFASRPEFRVTRQMRDKDSTGELFISFGDCSFGEFDGRVYGKEEYDRLNVEIDSFREHLNKKGASMVLRPWNFEVDPYRRHSLIAAAGVRFSEGLFAQVLGELREFLQG